MHRFAIASSALLAALLASSAAQAKDPVAVLLYDGIGTTKRARVWGRVLEDEGLDNPKPNESRWRRIKRSYRLLESDELPYARVELQILGKRYRVKADKEGLFALDVPGPLPLGSHRVSGRALGLGRRKQRSIDARLNVYAAKAGTLVISDIDDTVLKTGVKRKARMLWKVISSNFYKLQTYAGAPALYRKLRARGAAISFVSGSPINLYPRLRGFLALRRFPRGPLLLKNIGTDKLTEQIKYKLRKIRELLALLPGYRLLLIGDSGEKDPEIYRHLMTHYKKRVLAVLINRVTNESPKSRRFRGQLLFSSYAEAARYLERRGLL